MPDLGSDLIRVYKLDGLSWTAQTPVQAVKGSGPRHGAFVKSGAETYFYSFNELDNHITGYKVTYPTGGIALEQVEYVPSHGPGTSVPAGTKAAEINASPDNRFIVVSSRGEASLSIPNWDPKNSTKIPSDPLITFSVNSGGKLGLVQVAPAGGMNPRGFNLNKAGDKLVSALQDDNRVVVYERDVRTGKLGQAIAQTTVGSGPGTGPSTNGPNYAIFYEENKDCGRK